MTISTILKNLSLVTVGAVAVTFGFGEAANAVALTGSFQFNGIGDPISQVVITANKLNFSPNPTPIGLAAQTDSFTSFSSGFVRDVNSVAGLNGSPTLLSNVPFLDLGENDGIDILKLTEVSEYTFVNLGVTTAINLAYKGFFTSSTGDISQAFGNLTFQAIGNSTEVKNLLQGNGSITATFSGLTVATEPVPEPLTILGSLAAVGIGTALKKKQKKA